MVIDQEIRNKLAELLTYGEEGKQAFIKLCTKFLPKESHNAIIKMANGELTNKQFFEMINNDALDSYLETKDKDVFKILEASEETRNEFRDKPTEGNKGEIK